jgi:glutamine synthetase
MQHFNVPAESVDDDFFRTARCLRRLLDPRLPGDPRVGHEAAAGPGDRLPRPVPGEKTLIMNFSIRDPFTDEPYSRDPRNIAARPRPT